MSELIHARHRKSIASRLGRNGMRPSPLVFVVGCPRSGTTLLQRMLDAHSMLTVANDTHFIPRALEKWAPACIKDAVAGRRVALSPELLSGTRNYHRFHRLGLHDAAVDRAAQSSQSYGGFVRKLYAELASAHGKRWAGEKTPDYVRHVPLLHGLFPEARVIHILRDGRDVALSLMGWAHKTKGPGRLDLWDSQPLATCALWWQWMVRAGRDAARQLPSLRYHEIRYEVLAADPVTALRGIARFLDLPYQRAMAEFHLGKTRDRPGLSAKEAWQPATPGLRDWRSQMDEDDVALFEALAGETLSELGYALSGIVPSSSVQQTARDCRRWWRMHGKKPVTVTSRNGSAASSLPALPRRSTS